MNTTYIKPFVDAVQSVFTTMVQLKVTVDEPSVTHALPACDISAIIGMSGDVVGAVILCFAAPAATGIVGKFAGCKCPIGSPECADAMGELVNMVSGAAKAKFIGKKVSISTPSVVVGPGHSVAPPTQAVCVSLPCRTALGDFYVVIAIREMPAAAVAAA